MNDNPFVPLYTPTATLGSVSDDSDPFAILTKPSKGVNINRSIKPQKANMNNDRMTDILWQCPQCNLNNYDDINMCKACYAERYNVSDELKQLYIDAQNATKAINKEYDEIIKAINQHKNKMLLTVQNMSKRKEEEIINHYSNNNDDAEQSPKAIHSTFAVDINKDSILQSLDKLCGINTCHLPSIPDIRRDSCFATSVTINVTCTDIEDIESILNTDIIMNKTSDITGCKIRFSESNNSVDSLDSLDKKKINWTIESFEGRVGPCYKLEDLLPSTKYNISACIRNECGWSEWSESISLKTAMNAVQSIPSKDILIEFDEMKVDDQIDATDRHGGWYMAEIKEIDEEKGIKVHFTNWNERYDEWIKEKEKERIGGLNEYTLYCESLESAPNKIISEPKGYISKIDNKDYIVMLCYGVGIIRYDVERNEYNVLCEDEWLKNIDDYLFVSTSMDTNMNIFYIIHNFENITSYDVDHRRWIRNIDNNQDNEDEQDNIIEFYSVLTSFISDLSSYHGMVHCDNNDGKVLFGQYDGHSMVCDDINVIAQDIIPSDMIYCKSLNKILLIIDKPQYGSKSDRESVYQWFSMKLDDDNKYKLNLFVLEMKKHCAKCYVLGFDHLLFIILSGYAPPIYCYNISDGVLYETHKKLATMNEDIQAEYRYGIRIKDNIHLFDIINNKQIIFNIYDILPNQLYSIYSKQSKILLISGYSRKIEKIFDCVIPIHLQQIIFDFYPQFA